VKAKILRKTLPLVHQDVSSIAKNCVPFHDSFSGAQIASDGMDIARLKAPDTSTADFHAMVDGAAA
jgi:hypothetical protein